MSEEATWIDFHWFLSFNRCFPGKLVAARSSGERASCVPACIMGIDSHCCFPQQFHIKCDFLNFLLLFEMHISMTGLLDDSRQQQYWSRRLWITHYRGISPGLSLNIFCLDLNLTWIRRKSELQRLSACTLDFLTQMGRLRLSFTRGD